MRILFLTPGTGHFLCGSCLRDDALVRALRDLGHDAVMAPLYLPLVLEEAAPEQPVHMGGINMYLQHKLPLARHTPRPIEDLLDSTKLLRWVSSRADMTSAAELGELTLSTLRGEEGRQKKEVDKLVRWVTSLEPPDVIVLSNAMLIGVARRLKHETEARILCTLQGEAPFLDALTPPYREDSWRTIAERASDVDAFVPVSRHYGDLMQERLGLDPDRVHVVHNGIDLDGFAPAEAAPSVPTVGYLARMCVDKGLPTLVEAFLRLKRRESVPGLCLRAAGVVLAQDRSLLHDLEHKLEDAGCADACELLPNVTRAEKIELLRSLSVLSVPATYGESFGLFVVEALACGVPVVQPDHGAFPELLEATGGGVLCRPDDPESLADELERLLLDELLRKRLGEQGERAVRERFTSERMARDVESICRLAVAAR
ncbi:MAG: glycosyltransferase family 4 protein [Planctomycetota bacterium]|nr:glycosyltransferase family 4 protein [Planctomycetota bacterium]